MDSEWMGAFCTGPFNIITATTRQKTIYYKRANNRNRKEVLIMFFLFSHLWISEQGIWRAEDLPLRFSWNKASNSPLESSNSELY